MQIYIKTLTGKSQAYTFESDQTILQVKQVRNFNIWYPFSILSRIIAIPLPTPFWFYSIIPLASSREGRFGGCTNTSRVPGEANVGPFDPSRVRSGGRRNHAYGAAAQRRLGWSILIIVFYNLWIQPATVQYIKFSFGVECFLREMQLLTSSNSSKSVRKVSQIWSRKYEPA